MANEFIARKGLIALEDSQISGSLSVTGDITGSIFSGSFIGDGSQLSGIEGFPFTGSAGITGSLTVVGPVNATTFTGDGSQLTGIEGFPFTGSAKITGSLEVTGSVTATSFTGSLQGIATSASYIQLANVDGFTAYSASVNTAIDSVLDATTPLTATVNTTNSPFTITSQSIVVIDSTNGDVTVNLPDLNAINGTPEQKPILLYKNDYSQNVVYVQPSGSQLVNGTTQDLIVSIQIGIVYNPTSAGWVTEGTSYQSLAELELFFVPRTETGSLSVATASYVEYSNVANKPALVSGSEQITYSGLTGIPSGIISGSAQISDFGIFATTGSNGFNGDQSITGSLTVTGQVVAQTLNVQQVTSSIVYSSGSNIFGNDVSNTQQFTGSLQVSGSSHNILGFGKFDVNSQNTILTLNNPDNTKSPALSFAIGSSTRSIIQVNNSDSNLNFLVNSGDTTALSLNGTTGAATFSSSVTATQLNATTTAAGYAAILTNTNGASDSNGLLVKAGSTSTEYVVRFAPQSDASTFFTVKGNGNVGIGTASPAKKLDVYENSTASVAQYIRNTTVNGLLQVDGTSNFQVGTETNHPLFLLTNNATRVLITSSGNVLIGTTTDSGANQPLQVVKTGSSNYLRLQADNNASYDCAHLFTDGTNSVFAGMMRATSGLTGAYSIFTGGAVRFNVISSGNVGIGVMSPSSILEVRGSTSSPQFRISRSEQTNQGLTVQAGGGVTVFDSYDGTDTVFGSYTFNSTKASTTSTRMRIDGSGNVGIGIDSPSARLQVRGANELSTFFDAQNEGAAGATFDRIGNSYPFNRFLFQNGYINVGGSFQDYPVSIEARSGGGQLALTRSGAVAEIYMGGSTGAGTQLYVRSGGSGGVRLDAGATSWVSASDIRLKDVEKPIENAVESLSTLQTVYYSWKDSDNKSLHLGLIAQEVEAVFPEIVSESSIDEMKGVTYTELIPVLVKAIQEQQEQIEILKAEIQTLKQ